MPARVKPMEVLMDELETLVKQLKRAAITNLKEENQLGKETVTRYSVKFPELYAARRKSFCEMVELIFRELPSPELEEEQIQASTSRHVTFSYLRHFLKLFPETNAEYQESLKGVGTVSDTQLLDKLEQLQQQVSNLESTNKQQQETITDLQEQLKRCHDNCNVNGHTPPSGGKTEIKSEFINSDIVSEVFNEVRAEYAFTTPQPQPNSKLTQQEEHLLQQARLVTQWHLDRPDHYKLRVPMVLRAIQVITNKQLVPLSDIDEIDKTKSVIKMVELINQVCDQLGLEPTKKNQDKTRKRLTKTPKHSDAVPALLKDTEEAITEVSNPSLAEEMKEEAQTQEIVQSLAEGEVALIVKAGNLQKLDLTDSNTKIDLGKANKLIVDAGLKQVPSIQEDIALRG